MAHLITHRRKLAASDPKTKPSSSMDVEDPTSQKHPLPTTKTHPQKQPDPTIETISHHFSELYANHKLLASCKGSNGHVDTHLQAKAMAKSTISDASSRQNRRHFTDVKKEDKKSTGGANKVKEKDKKSLKDFDGGNDVIKTVFIQGKEEDVAKKLSKKECGKKEFDEGDELKRPSISAGMMRVDRRRSFCSSQVELADYLRCSGVKVVSVDMPPFMQIHAVDCARKAHDSLEKFTSKSLAFTLKKEFDGVYGPAWHCIVGTNFGSFVTHSVGGFLYFALDHKTYILLFKTAVQRATE